MNTERLCHVTSSYSAEAAETWRCNLKLRFSLAATTSLNDDQIPNFIVGHSSLVNFITHLQVY